MEKDNTRKKGWNLILELIKVLAPIGTLILAFCIYKQVTLPGSDLNKQENTRQQAQLLIDLFKEDNVFKLKTGYDIILATQKAIDTPINLQKIDSLFKQRVFEREKVELKNAYTDLLIKRVELTRKYDTYDGIGDGKIGESAIAPDISFLLKFIDNQARKLENKMREHGVDLTTITYYKEYNEFIRG